MAFIKNNVDLEEIRPKYMVSKFIIGPFDGAKIQKNRNYAPFGKKFHCKATARINAKNFAAEFFAMIFTIFAPCF